MSTCPNGHQSGSDDWCEVCGHRMAGAVPPPPPPPGMPGAVPANPRGAPGAPGTGGGYGYPDPQAHQPQQQGSPASPPYIPHTEMCPQCGTPREAMAPFCEECRYNFLTHTPTTFAPPPPAQPGQDLLPPAFQQPQHTQPPQSFDYQSSRPSQMNRPAEPLVPEQGAGGQAAPPRAPQPQAPYPPQQPGAFPPPQGPPPGPPQGPSQGPPPQGPPQGPPQHGQHMGQPPRQQQPGRYDDDWTLPPPAAQQAPQAPHTQQAPHASQHGQEPPQAQGGDWVAVVAPDREYFTAMMTRSGPEASGLNLPAYSPEQQLQLTGPQMTIGRRRHSTGESPDIDLSRPPEDPGVSHQHAMLVQQPGGSWSVIDQDSTNGTTINGAEDPIQPFVPVPLQEGDRVHVGAWTTITVRRG